jgi:hypothetical protein
MARIASPSFRVEDGAVTAVRLGASCDFVTEDEYHQSLVKETWPADEVLSLVEAFKHRVDFVVHEFAELADGRRITLHEERRFSIASREPAPSEKWRFRTSDLARAVRLSVLPDDDDTQEEHSCERLAGLLHLHGVEATVEELRRLPYDIVFSERLRARLVTDA